MFDRHVSQEIKLKLLTKNDAPYLFQLIDEHREALSEWLPWINNKQQEEDVLESIIKWGNMYLEDEGIDSGVFYQGHLVGMVGLRNINRQEHKAELGYWLAPPYQGKGIISRALFELINYSLTNLKLNRLEIRSPEENYKSKKLAENLGFTFQEVIPDGYKLNDKTHNLFVYRLIASEWFD